MGINYNFKFAKKVRLAFCSLNREGKLVEYCLSNITPKKWVFAAPRERRRSLFYKRIGGKSRFAHSQKRVLYLASSSWRVLLETSSKEKCRRRLYFFRFYNNEQFGNDISKPPCLYLITLKRGIKLFNIGDDTKINKLDQELNRFLKHPLKDIIHRAVNVRSASAYFFSLYVANVIYALGFDGILYKPKTQFYGGNDSPILGSINNSMIIIFEKKDRKNIIIDVPSDEEDMRCDTC
ncbi:MAG: hypothetical protein US89_C0021G0007 [Candidatus Peregrinibacteria bacterium GW2011_GWF2_38_29]|nr:MAG: hypothetical protein US89_C0021G0007 [Candidatus Peregrinibacteria bacterium GW2011_GWF2_38_29]